MPVTFGCISRQTKVNFNFIGYLSSSLLFKLIRRTTLNNLCKIHYTKKNHYRNDT